MNTDETFNYYCEKMLAKHGELEAKRLETAMSQMLEMRCTESVVWDYAKREVNSKYFKETVGQ